MEPNAQIGADTTSFIFMVDPPKIMLDSLLLAMSIRKHFNDAKIYAYCPKDKIEIIPNPVRGIFDNLGVYISPISNRDIFSPDYPHGNKIIACASHVDSGNVIFLDSDTVIYSHFSPSNTIKFQTLYAVPADLKSWGKSDEEWRTAYKLFGLPLPDRRVATVRSKQSSIPYFNAGMIAYKNSEVRGFKNFGEMWLDTALKLDSESTILEKRPWLDQIALPISIERAEWQFNPLDERWNLGVNLIRSKDSVNRVNNDDPIIIHYHHHRHLNRFKFKNYLRELLLEYTCFPDIRSIKKAIASIDEGTREHGECWINPKHGTHV